MKFVIVGHGRFGIIAVERLRDAFPNRHMIIVDQDSKKLSGQPVPDATMVIGDATSFLLDCRELEPEDVVVPMVPFHLAALYVMAKSPDVHEIRIPEALLALVPNPLQTSSSTLLASRADFLCPDDCPEGECCTVTGLPAEPLHVMLARLTIPGFTVMVQQSHQILPGVGGYTIGDLQRLSAQLTRGLYILATSCKCHSVLTAMRKE